jgi:DNA invertase Pin-like site-specific DNA recombinase
MENSIKYVAYYRVSTQKQGASGLGLEAQKATVLNFTKCDTCIIAEFTEIESGKKTDRKELDKALTYAKEHNATLIVAKLDRLARNVEFIFKLKNSGVNFKACDLSDFNTLTVGIFATMAQHERELISKRTKDALTAKKARGQKLGIKGTENLEKSGATEKSIKVRVENAKTAKENIQAMELICIYSEKGMTLKAIAEKLNASGYKTRRGKSFTTSQVQMFLKRAKTATFFQVVNK